MSYPVAYRTGARANITRSRWVDPKAFTERYIPPKAGIAKETFRPRIPPTFGKRTAAELALELLERQVAKKARTAAARLIPGIGEVLLVSDGLDIIVDGFEIITTYPNAHTVTPVVGHKSELRAPGWNTEVIPESQLQALAEQGYAITPTGNNAVVGMKGGRYQTKAIVWSQHDVDLAEWKYGVGTTIVDDDVTAIADMRQYTQTVWYNWGRQYPDGSIIVYPGDRVVVQEWWKTNPEAPTPYFEEVPVYGPPQIEYGEPVEVKTPVRLPIADDIPVDPRLTSKEVGHDYRPIQQQRDPTRIPAIITTVSPTGITSKPGAHSLSPQTKERKVIASVPHKVIASLITESLDVILAFHDALPIQYQYGARMMHKRGGGVYWRIDTYKGKKEKPNHIEALRQLYAHWDKVDMKEAFTNLAKNEIEDRLIGSAAQRTNKSLRKWYNLSGRPVGVFSGSAL